MGVIGGELLRMDDEWLSSGGSIDRKVLIECEGVDYFESLHHCKTRAINQAEILIVISI